MCLRKAIKMAYNNFFPTSYQQMPYPQQAFQQNNISPQQPNMQNMQYQQTMTPPTIHAEIIQANKAEAMNFPVGLGQTQMFMAKDDSAIFIKTVFSNGQSNFVEYPRKQEEVAKPQENYITREEFETRLNELFPQKKTSAPQRKEKTE